MTAIAGSDKILSDMSHKTISGTLASAVADDATVVVGFPSGYDEGDFYLGVDHRLVMGGAKLTAPIGFTVALGSTGATVTNKTGASWPEGTEYWLELNIPGERELVDARTKKRIARLVTTRLAMINLGAPDALDADGICESQSGAAGALSIDGALASGGVATLDKPRNVIADSGGADTATLTITGTDEYGVTMTEDITLNGTTAVPGKKAFKTITSVVSDATISNGAFLGTGDVLGLPVFLGDSIQIIEEWEDGAAATAGTVVTGDQTAEGATATTGDVRGTYDPNSACDGDAVFQILVMLTDETYLGVPQA